MVVHIGIADAGVIYTKTHAVFHHIVHLLLYAQH